MLARRVIAISPDKAIAKRLGLGLRAAGGSVETYESADSLPKGDIQASLLVVSLEPGKIDELAALGERLDDGYLIAVLPKSNLVDSVAALQATDRLVGLLIADEMTTESIAAMAYRVLHGDIFGLEKVIPWGTKIYSLLVGDYQEKSICISQISEFAKVMGVRRKYREQIEQVLDEMLMNALYDAPVDSEGKPMFADVPTKTRISLRMEQKAVVQYACDGETFTVSVRDSFGTLDRETVLRYLHKCLHSEQQIDRKTGGAGLGLYIMANSTTQFLFNVLPGVATEVICTFDLTAPKVQLKEFGFFPEKIDPAGRLVGGPSKLLPAGASYPVERRDAPPPGPSRGVTLALGAAIVLLVALIGLVAYPRFAKGPTGGIRVATTPAGATIELDGASRGGTGSGPLTIKDLSTARTYRITATKAGYEPKTELISPVEDTITSLELTLEPKAVVARIDSEPQGAEVFHDGKRLGVTPFNTDALPASQEVELTFRRTGYVDGNRTVQLPGPGGQLTISHSLSIDPSWGTASITTEPPGATIYHNGTRLPKETPVAELLIPSGEPQRFTLKLDGYQPAHRTVTAKPGQRAVPVEAKLAKGGSLTVTSEDLPDAVVSVRGVRKCRRVPMPMRDCPLANGKYTFEVVSGRPYARLREEVRIKNNDVVHAVKVGIVRAGDGNRIEIRGWKTDKVALREGTHKLTVVPDEGEPTEVAVEIEAGKSYTVP